MKALRMWRIFVLVCRNLACTEGKQRGNHGVNKDREIMIGIVESKIASVSQYCHAMVS